MQQQLHLLLFLRDNPPLYFLVLGGIVCKVGIPATSESNAASSDSAYASGSTTLMAGDQSPDTMGVPRGMGGISPRPKLLRDTPSRLWSSSFPEASECGWRTPLLAPLAHQFGRRRPRVLHRKRLSEPRCPISDPSFVGQGQSPSNPSGNANPPVENRSTPRLGLS